MNRERQTTAALEYARRLQWAVFPIYEMTEAGECSCGHEKCTSPGKHPRTKNGHNDASTDPECIQTMWSRCPNANIGVQTGPASGIDVLDIDFRSGGEQSFDNLVAANGEPPRTVAQSTGGGGRHLFFRCDEEMRSRSGVVPGVDIRAGGGYIIVPPSNHISGDRYTWESSGHPAVVDIAPWPQEWLEALQADSRAPAPQQGDSIIEGGRNATLTRLAGTMRNRAMSEAAIRAALLVTNDERCNPPLLQSEVSSIAQSVARYEPGVPPLGRSEQNERQIVFTPASSISMRPTRWLWNEDGGRIPAGEITLTAGPGGVGKSTFHAWLIAKITTGTLPGIHFGKPASCIIAAQEDSWAQTIVPRLVAAGADLDRVYRVDVVESE